MKRMKANDLHNFIFEYAGSGCARVTYFTDSRGDYWSAYTHDMGIIDVTKECGTSDILSVSMLPNKRKDKEGLINQTEKPVKLMEILIRNSSNTGDVVLDSFLWSGTTARTCVNLEKYLGFELGKRQVEFADNGLSRMNRQMDIFI